MKFSREYNDAMIAFNKTLARAGALLAVEELEPSSSGIRIMYPMHGGEPEVKAGPFPVEQGLMAGYTLIHATTEDEAVEWALRMPFPANHGYHEIELRKLKDTPESTRDPREWAMKAEFEEQINLF